MSLSPSTIILAWVGDDKMVIHLKEEWEILIKEFQESDSVNANGVILMEKIEKCCNTGFHVYFDDLIIKELF